MLKNGKWALKYDCCIRCRTTEIKHIGCGLCRRCYQKKHRKENPEKSKKNFTRYRKKNLAKFREYSKKYRRENPEIFKERHRIYYKNNKEKAKKYYDDNIERIKKNQKIFNKENPEILKERHRIYYKNNKEKIKESCRKYYIENRDERQAYGKKYREKNPGGMRKWRKENPEKSKKLQKNYIKKNPQYKLKQRISSMVWTRLKKRLSSKEGKRTWDYLPYTVDELIQHLEELFQPGMTWQNHGEWHIDHKRPDCSFDYKSVDDKEFQKCWALENLQPLWAVDNIKKGGNWND